MEPVFGATVKFPFLIFSGSLDICVQYRFHKRFIAPYPWYKVKNSIDTIRLRCCICYAHVRSIFDRETPYKGCEMLINLGLEL